VAVSVELHLPASLVFLREQGANAVAVLLALVAEADWVDGRLVVGASTRGVAARLGFLGKDSVGRRLRQLRRAGVLEELPRDGVTSAPTFVLRLDATGIEVHTCES
jgi:hypothetical protein